MFAVIYSKFSIEKYNLYSISTPPSEVCRGWRGYAVAKQVGSKWEKDNNTSAVESPEVLTTSTARHFTCCASS
jgi:hypothetical protein